MSFYGMFKIFRGGERFSCLYSKENMPIFSQMGAERGLMLPYTLL